MKLAGNMEKALCGEMELGLKTTIRSTLWILISKPICMICGKLVDSHIPMCFGVLIWIAKLLEPQPTQEVLLGTYVN